MYCLLTPSFFCCANAGVALPVGWANKMTVLGSQQNTLRQRRQNTAASCCCSISAFAIGLKAREGLFGQTISGLRATALSSLQQSERVKVQTSFEVISRFMWRIKGEHRLVMKEKKAIREREREGPASTGKKTELVLCFKVIATTLNNIFLLRHATFFKKTR